MLNSPANIVSDACVPGYGMIGSHGFSEHAMAWLDSELAVRNANSYAGFAMDLSKTLYTGQIPPAVFETSGASAVLERKQESIDGVLSILRKYDTLKRVVAVFVAPPKSLPKPPPTSNAAPGSLRRQFDGYCNEQKRWEVKLDAEGQCIGFEVEKQYHLGWVTARGMSSSRISPFPRTPLCLEQY